MARVSYPGQFCLLSVPGVFLRRPFSIFVAFGDTLEFYYKVIGRGTKQLSLMKKGEVLDVFGPLGTGYPLKPENKTTTLIVAGGTGIASLHFLATKLKKPGIIFYGSRCSKEILDLRSLAKNGWKLRISTDDGSKGFSGFVTDDFRGFLGSDKARKFTVFACGPEKMLERVHNTARKYGLRTFVSLEEMMACGTGNCQGCAVKTNDGYLMACSDGPVFNSEEIIWE